MARGEGEVVSRISTRAKAPTVSVMLVMTLLTVPVVKGVDRLSVRDLSLEISRLGEAAKQQERSIDVEEPRGVGGIVED